MSPQITEEYLIAFEKSVEDLYLQAKIKSPVHFSGGNESQLIEIFKNVKPSDWVFSTHRSHYHALLKGIPEEIVKEEILQNRSIHLNNRDYKFFTSAIVGGILPIAVGTALGAKLKHLDEHVWAFVGDMAAEMGIFHECAKYSARNNLAITFVVEDNGMSVDTPTQKVWGDSLSSPKIIKYSYTRVYPHHGCGKWVQF